MNIKWTTIAGFGPRAWNHEEQSMRVPLHHMEKHSEEPKEVTPPQAKKQDSDFRQNDKIQPQFSLLDW